MLRIGVLLGIGLMGALALPGTASAQSVSIIGEFRDWSAYSTSDGTGALCFAMAKVKSVEPTPDGYTQAYLYMTHRTSRNITNEINLVAGFEFAPDQPAILTVGGQEFELFTQKDAAWLLDTSKSDSLAAAIRAGSTLTITSTTSRGIRVEQTFSLSGATAASRAIGGC
jgi:hypothetical protein